MFIPQDEYDSFIERRKRRPDAPAEPPAPDFWGMASFKEGPDYGAAQDQQERDMAGAMIPPLEQLRRPMPEPPDRLAALPQTEDARAQSFLGRLARPFGEVPPRPDLGSLWDAGKLNEAARANVPGYAELSDVAGRSWQNIGEASKTISGYATEPLETARLVQPVDEAGMPRPRRPFERLGLTSAPLPEDQSPPAVLERMNQRTAEGRPYLPIGEIPFFVGPGTGAKLVGRLGADIAGTARLTAPTVGRGLRALDEAATNPALRRIVPGATIEDATAAAKAAAEREAAMRAGQTAIPEAGAPTADQYLAAKQANPQAAYEAQLARDKPTVDAFNQQMEAEIARKQAALDAAKAGGTPPSEPPKPPTATGSGGELPPREQIPLAPPPQGGVLPRFPTNVELEARTQKGGWLSNLGRWAAKGPVPGVKGALNLIDPWVAQQTHLERIPLVYRQMEAMGGDIVRTAMAQLEGIPLPGVKIKDGRFIEGVTPRTPGLSMATSDVVEHIGRYNVTPELLDFIRTANRLGDDLLGWAKTEGAKIRQIKFEPGGHYFGRLVREIRDIEKKGKTRPDMPRHYDSMEAGMDSGVVYSDDLLATAQAGYSWLIRKITSQRMGQFAKELGRTPKQLIDAEVTARAVTATNNLRIVRNYDRTLRAMRDGMEPTFQVQVPGAAAGQRVRTQLTAIDKVEPGISQQVLATWERVKNLAVKDTTRRDAFNQLLDDLRPVAKRALAERNTAVGERAKALRGLQSPEFAEGERFGLPKGTVGVGSVRQSWAAGRAFPREVADYLNATFGDTAGKIVKAFDTVSSTSRTLVAGFDFGTTQIQLQGAMFSRPHVWAKANRMMFEATANPPVYHAYMAQPTTQAVLEELIPHGLTIEGAEYAQELGRGGSLQRLAALAGPRVGGAIERQGLHRAEMAFTAPLNVGKIEFAKALLSAARRAGELDELAMFLNNITGTRSSLAAGIGGGQRGFESAFGFFSPRFTRSSMAIVGDAFQGGLKGREARRSLASLLAGSMLITGGLRSALGQPITPEFFDPRSPEFLTAELWGVRAGLGGPYRAMATTLGQSYMTARTDPGKFLDLKDRRENPIVRWWSGRSAPVTGLLWDAVEGRDFLGEPLNTSGALAERTAKMVTPMAASDFIPSAGGKRPELGSIIPNILGLRAVQLSPAMERDRLRNQYANKEYGQDWEKIDRAKQAAIETKYPNVVQAATAAIETYSRRGSLLHEFRQDTAKVREEPEQQIAALTTQLRAGQISGQEYRKAVQEREAQMAQAATVLQKTSKYQGIPVKEEEWQQWAERQGQTMPERTTPVDKFLDAYYKTASDMRDPQTGELNPSQLVKARETLKSTYPAEVVKEAMTYINRHRDPEYVKAQAEFSTYMSMPKYYGMTAEQGQLADKTVSVISYIQATSKRTGKFVNPLPIVKKLYGPDALKFAAMAKGQTKGTFERYKYRQQHPLIDKFYGQAPQGVAPRDLMAVGQ